MLLLLLLLLLLLWCMRLRRHVSIRLLVAALSVCVGQQYPEWIGPGAASVPRSNDELALSHLAQRCGR